MSEWLDKAIVLRMGLFGEANLWLRMLCREHGLSTIFAFGGAKSKKRFCGCLDIFNSLDCRVKVSRSGSYLNLAEASLLEGTRNLRANWKNMGIAANCLRFMDALAISRESAAECYVILENLRLFLERDQSGLRLMPLFFRLRVAAALGFAPSLSRCAKCGAPIGGDGYFMTDEGRALCETCHKLSCASEKYAIQVSGYCLGILAEIQRCEPCRWGEYVLSGSEIATCARLIDAFVEYHLGLAWDNGFFRRV